MNLADIPLFGMLRSRLGYLSERQRVISENVANSDTPGFTPRDLKAFSFEAQMQAAKGLPMNAAQGQAMTQAGHMQSPTARRGAGAQFRSKPTKDSETTLDGNSVVLEEEMMKMSQARMDYDAAIGFYQKSLTLLRMAARRPGA